MAKEPFLGQHKGEKTRTRSNSSGMTLFPSSSNIIPKSVRARSGTTTMANAASSSQGNNTPSLASSSLDVGSSSSSAIPKISFIETVSSVDEIFQLNERIAFYHELTGRKDENRNILLEQCLLQQIIFLHNLLNRTSYNTTYKQYHTVKRQGHKNIPYQFQRYKYTLPAVGELAGYYFYEMAANKDRISLKKLLGKNKWPTEFHEALAEVMENRERFENPLSKHPVMRARNYYYSLKRLNYTLLFYLTKFSYKDASQESFDEKKFSELHELLLAVNQKINFLLKKYLDTSRERYKQCEELTRDFLVDFLKQSEYDASKILEIFNDGLLEDFEVIEKLQVYFPGLVEKYGVTRLVNSNNCVIRKIYKKDENGNEDISQPAMAFHIGKGNLSSEKALIVAELSNSLAGPYLVEPFLTLSKIISEKTVFGFLNVYPFLPLGNLFSFSDICRDKNISLIERQYLAVRLCAQVCDFLIQLWKHKIIYPDIKPENILVVYDEKNDIYDIQIIDLKSLERITTDNNIVNQQVFGKHTTKMYCAPEMNDIGKDVNIPQSYLWLVGVLLYGFLTEKTHNTKIWLDQYQENQFQGLDVTADIFKQGGNSGKKLVGLCERLLQQKPEERGFVGIKSLGKELHHLEGQLFKKLHSEQNNLRETSTSTSSPSTSSASSSSNLIKHSGVFQKEEKEVSSELFNKYIEELQTILISLAESESGEPAEDESYERSIVDLLEEMNMSLGYFKTALQSDDSPLKNKMIRDQFIILKKILTTLTKKIESNTLQNADKETKDKILRLHARILKDPFFNYYYNISFSNSRDCTSSGSTISSKRFGHSPSTS